MVGKGNPHPLAPPVRRAIPWAVSLKIVFNGKEYDSVEAMPPDVRKEYEVALETLRKSGGEEILSVLQRDMGVRGAHIGRHRFDAVVLFAIEDDLQAHGPRYGAADA